MTNWDVKVALTEQQNKVIERRERQPKRYTILFTSIFIR